MKKFILSCFAIGTIVTLTGCSTIFVGEPKKPEQKKQPPVVNVIHNHYYFMVVPEEKKMDADHRKQRGKNENFSGGPRHRDDPSRKTPGDPGARR